LNIGNCALGCVGMTSARTSTKPSTGTSNRTGAEMRVATVSVIDAIQERCHIVDTIDVELVANNCPPLGRAELRGMVRTQIPTVGIVV
jgi:hypothetical protein